MTIAGLWHGASINFILWGFLNGIFLVLEKKFNIRNNKKIFQIILNCFIIFNLWLIFRITEIKSLINYFYTIYFNLNEIFILENLLIFLVICFAIYCQKFENLITIKKFSSKLSFAVLKHWTI
jgi:D-alanyl-lipoteichoic acid acyltransferase DltB (MBOAT superfamily)